MADNAKILTVRWCFAAFVLQMPVRCLVSYAPSAKPVANSGETPSPCAQLIERDGQSGLVGHGCQLGRQIKGDAMAARALAFDRTLGALLLLSLVSLARDDPRAHIVPRAKPTVVCAVCRGICHSGTGRARGAGL